MKFKRIGKKAPQESINTDFGYLHENRRNNVSPPYTAEELNKIEYFDYLYLKFLQESGLSTRQLISKQEDLANIVIRFKDLTDEGNFFDRNFEQFCSPSDFNVDPNKRVKRILVKGLKEMREAHAKGEIDYTDYIVKE